MLSYLDFCNLSKNFFSVSFGGFISIFTIINYESFIELSLLKNLIKLKCLFNDIEFNYFFINRFNSSADFYRITSWIYHFISICSWDFDLLWNSAVSNLTTLARPKSYLYLIKKHDSLFPLRFIIIKYIFIG